MIRNTAIALGVAATLLWVGGAAAAGPVTSPASFELHLEADPFHESLRPGESADTQVRLSISTSGTSICTFPSTVRIFLEVHELSPDLGFLGEITPGSLSFPIPAGIFLDLAGGWQSESLNATFTAIIAEDWQPLHHHHTYLIVARFESSNPPASCQGMYWEDSEAIAPVSIHVEPGDAESAEAAQQEPQGDAPVAPIATLPGPAFTAVVLPTTLLLAIRRRTPR